MAASDNIPVWLMIVVISYNPHSLPHLLLPWTVVLWSFTAITIDAHNCLFFSYLCTHANHWFLYFFLIILQKFPQSSFNLAFLSDSKILSLWYQCVLSSVVDDSVTPSGPAVAIHIYIPVDNIMWLPWFTLLILWLTLTILIIRYKENNF